MTADRSVREGQPGQNRPSLYRFLRYMPGTRNTALFIEAGGGARVEVFERRRTGVAGWALYVQGDTWEFCRGVTYDDVKGLT